MLQHLAVSALLSAPMLPARNNWFNPALLDHPDVAKAVQSIDEWIRITEIPWFNATATS